MSAKAASQQRLEPHGRKRQAPWPRTHRLPLRTFSPAEGRSPAAANARLPLPSLSDSAGQRPHAATASTEPCGVGQQQSFCPGPLHPPHLHTASPRSSTGHQRFSGSLNNSSQPSSHTESAHKSRCSQTFISPPTRKPVSPWPDNYLRLSRTVVTGRWCVSAWAGMRC